MVWISCLMLCCVASVAAAQSTGADPQKPKTAAASVTATVDTQEGVPPAIYCSAKPSVTDNRYRLFSRGGTVAKPAAISNLEMRSARISAIGDKEHPVYKISHDRCVPEPVEITVPNFQNVAVRLMTYYGDTCVSVPAFKADPKPDYGATLTALFKYLPPFVGSLSLLEDESPAKEQKSVWQTILLPTSKNSTLTATITCLPAKLTGPNDPEQPAQLPRTVIVHFRGVPVVSGSAGVLFSTLGNRTYGAVTQQTGSNSAGVATTQNYVGLTASSRVQFVPTGFVNLYLIGTPQLHFDFQSGAGINPYGSKVKVEYFLGPAIAWHGVYLSPGVHIAQAQHLINGFTAGEPIASGTTPATMYSTTYKLGFAISYSPPIASK